MAAAFVQAKASTEGSSVTSLATTFDSATTTGNLVHANAACYDTDAVPPTNFTVTDNSSSTFSNTGAPSRTFNTNARIEVKYAPNITGRSGHQVTVAFGDTVFATVGILELSGVATSSPADGSNNNAGTGTAVTSGAVTPSGNGIFVGGMSYDATFQTLSVNWTGGTQRLEIDENNDAAAQNIATKAATASTSDNAGWTVSTSVPWGAVLIAYKEGTAATTISVPVATHSYTGATPQVRARVAAPVRTHTYTAQTPQVRARVMPAPATHTYSGVAPEVRARVMPGAATHTYVGIAPGITSSPTVVALAAAHSYAGQAPQVRARVAPGAAAHTYTPATPQVRASVRPGAATHTYSGQAPSFPRRVAAVVATHAYVGVVPKASARVMPGDATHAYLGIAPAVSAGNALTAPAVTHVYVGITPQVRAKVAVPVRAHAYIAQAPQVRTSVAPPAAGHTYTGAVPQLRSRVSVPAVNHLYVGRVPGVATGNSVSVPVATHTYTGRLPTVFGAVVVAAPVAAHSYTAQVPVFTTVGPFVPTGTSLRDRIGRVAGAGGDGRVGSPAPARAGRRIGSRKG